MKKSFIILTFIFIAFHFQAFGQGQSLSFYSSTLNLPEPNYDSDDYKTRHYSVGFLYKLKKGNSIWLDLNGHYLKGRTLMFNRIEMKNVADSIRLLKNISHNASRLRIGFGIHDTRKINKNFFWNYGVYLGVNLINGQEVISQAFDTTKTVVFPGGFVSTRFEQSSWEYADGAKIKKTAFSTAPFIGFGWNINRRLIVRMQMNYNILYFDKRSVGDKFELLPLVLQYNF